MAKHFPNNINQLHVNDPFSVRYFVLKIPVFIMITSNLHNKQTATDDR